MKTLACCNRIQSLISTFLVNIVFARVYTGQSTLLLTHSKDIAALCGIGKKILNGEA